MLPLPNTVFSLSVGVNRLSPGLRAAGRRLFRLSLPYVLTAARLPRTLASLRLPITRFCAPSPTAVLGVGMVMYCGWLPFSTKFGADTGILNGV